MRKPIAVFKSQLRHRYLRVHTLQKCPGAGAAAGMVRHLHHTDTSQFRIMQEFRLGLCMDIAHNECPKITLLNIGNQ